MRTIARLVAAGLATTALIAGSATSATAQSQKIKDKRADVVSYNGIDDVDGSVLDREASIATGIDATSATIKYTKKSFKVTVKFAKLTKDRVFVQSLIRVKGAKHSPKYILMNDGNNKKIFVYDRPMEKKLCTGKLVRKTGNSGSITLTVKRSCFDKAKSIKVQTGFYNLPNGLDDEADFIVNFEAISAKKSKTPTWSKWLKAS